MEGDGSPLSSLCMVRAAELFPPVQPEKEDDSLQVMFIECKLNAKLPFVNPRIHFKLRKKIHVCICSARRICTLFGPNR